MRRQNLVLLLSLSLVFLSGVAVGGFGYRLTFGDCSKKPRKTADDARREYVQSLTKAASLQPDQVSKVNQILIDTRSEYFRIHKRIDPDLKALHQRQIDQIRAVLTPAQQAKFDEWRTERENEAKKKR